jgi:hypothetical protein
MEKNKMIQNFLNLIPVIAGILGSALGLLMALSLVKSAKIGKTAPKPAVCCRNPGCGGIKKYDRFFLGASGILYNVYVCDSCNCTTITASTGNSEKIISN